MIFLDTSFLVSFYNKEDNNHKKAWEVMQHLLSGRYGDICISDYVFDAKILDKPRTSVRGESWTSKNPNKLRTLVRSETQGFFDECATVIFTRLNKLMPFGQLR